MDRNHFCIQIMKGNTMVKKAAQIVPLVERIRTELKTRLADYNKNLKKAIKTLEEGKAQLPGLKAAYKEAEKTSNEAEKIYSKAEDIRYDAEMELSDVESEIDYAKHDIPELKEKIIEAAIMIHQTSEDMGYHSDPSQRPEFDKKFQKAWDRFIEILDKVGLNEPSQK